MKIRTAIWCFLLLCCSFALAQTLPLQTTPTAASVGWPTWAWGCIGLACVIGGLYVYLRKKQPAKLASLETAATKVETTLSADWKAIIDKLDKHANDANAVAASSNQVALAALAKTPVATAQTVTAKTAAAPPADAAGTTTAPAPAAPTIGVRNVQPGKPFSIFPPNPTHSIDIEGPYMVRWLNGAQEMPDNTPINPPTPPAHDPGDFSKYWTTMETQWTNHPEWGTGPDSWELAYQAAVAQLAGTIYTPPSIPGTGKFTLASMSDYDWAYLLGTMMNRVSSTPGYDMIGAMNAVFSDTNIAVRGAWNSWYNANTSFRNDPRWPIALYNGQLLGAI